MIHFYRSLESVIPRTHLDRLDTSININHTHIINRNHQLLKIKSKNSPIRQLRKFSKRSRHTVLYLLLKSIQLLNISAFQCDLK